jgi:hypothetical protein
VVEILRPEGEWDVVLGTGKQFPLRQEYIDSIVSIELTQGGILDDKLADI